MNPGLSATEELRTLGALLRAPFAALLDHVFDRLREAGFDDVRPAHGAVLRNIAREGNRITELAERARMTKQSMAELIEYLRKREYLEFAPDPSDGRAKLARLTARGWKVHDTLVRSSREFERICARGLGEAKWRALRSLLEEFAAWSRDYSPNFRHGSQPGDHDDGGRIAERVGKAGINSRRSRNSGGPKTA